MTSRRGFLIGLGSALAAPAVIRTAGLLMPVKSLIVPAPMALTEVMLRQQALIDKMMDAHVWLTSEAMHDLVCFGQAAIDIRPGAIAGVHGRIIPLDIYLREASA